MNSMHSAATTATPVAPASLQSGSIAQNPTYAARLGQGSKVEPSPKPAGYGLPCAKCRTYYTADLKACPVCKSNERVSPVTRPVHNGVTVEAQKLPAPATIEEERERFLREFQAKMLAAHPTQASAATAPCTQGGNHPTTPQPAVICQSCFDQLQERVDVLEAALHIDMKEATQLIYDAVWAEPTEPEKTYQNAAAALLGELRRRSGVTPTFHAQMPRLD